MESYERYDVSVEKACEVNVEVFGENQDANWNKWTTKCNELNKSKTLSDFPESVTTSDGADADQTRHDVDGVFNQDTDAANAQVTGDCKNDIDSKTRQTESKQSKDVANATILKRTSTAPELYGAAKVHATKVLKKRNTMPGSVTKTLLMVGRLHDVDETAIEGQLNHLAPGVGKTCDKGMGDIKGGEEHGVNIAVEIEPGLVQSEAKSTEDNNGDQKDVDENKAMSDVLEQHDTLLGANVDEEQRCNEVNVDTKRRDSTVAPANLKTAAVKIAFQLNDEAVDADVSLPVPEITIDPNTAEETIIIERTVPCDEEMGVCGGATASEPDTSSHMERPVDENLLFVGNPDTSSLNGFDISEVDTSKQTSENESGSPVKKSTLSRQDSGVYNGQLSADENLEEARSRMHTLLDEAFSLITPRTSMTEHDVRHKHQAEMTSPTSDKSEEPSTEKKRSSRWSIQTDQGMDAEVKHEPMFVNPTYSSSYSDFPLETWSPYRAFDQVALISMPQKLEPEPTRLGHKSEVIQTHPPKSTKRPAATFDINESKSVSAIDDTKYTTSPPKPIVLRTKDLPSSQADAGKGTSSKWAQQRKFSTAGFNGDVTGSTASISGQKAKSGTDRMELKSYPNGSERRHRAPSKDLRNNDEVDIINNLKPTEKSDDLLKSLRDELNVLKENYKDPKSGKRRKSQPRSMTEIV